MHSLLVMNIDRCTCCLLTLSLAWTFATACGPAEGVEDAGNDAAVIDAAFDVPFANDADVTVSSTCDVHAPFTSSTIVGGVPSANASLSPDELTIFFDGYNVNDSGIPDYVNHIFTAQRSSITASFGPASLLTELDQDAAPFPNNEAPWVLPDLKTIYYASTYGNLVQLVAATRPTSTAAFSAPAQVSALDVSDAQSSPTLAGDGSEIFFMSTRDGAGWQLYRSTVAGSSFGSPVAVSELTNVNGGDHNLNSPVRGANSLVLYFSVTTFLNPGNMTGVWRAERATPGDSFTNITAVDEVNADSSVESIPLWLSNDACRLYVKQTRANVRLMYVYERKPA